MGHDEVAQILRARPRHDFSLADPGVAHRLHPSPHFANGPFQRVKIPVASTVTITETSQIDLWRVAWIVRSQADLAAVLGMGLQNDPGEPTAAFRSEDAL